MVAVIRRCQSKKHSRGGCGAPNCPEGLSIRQAMNEALANEDIAAYLEARGKLETRPWHVSKEAGFLELYYGRTDVKEVVVRIPPNRPRVKAAIAKLDMLETPSFETINDIKDYVEERYAGTVDFVVKVTESSEGTWKSLEVRKMYVDADVRSFGIGSQLRRIILKHAEENNLLVFGDPSPGGDGSMIVDDENREVFKQKAKEHKERLIKFYLKHGYVLNPCAPSVFDDPDSEEVQKYKEIEQSKLTDEAKSFLNASDAYVKFPIKDSITIGHTSYPKSMIRDSIVLN